MTTRVRRGSTKTSGAPDAFGVSGQGEATFINCTQHTVRLMREGKPDLVLPPRAIPARVAFIKVGTAAGVDIMQREGDVEELPAPALNTLYIVSRMVKDQVPLRNDVVVPHGLFNDAHANVVRCRGVAL